MNTFAGLIQLHILRPYPLFSVYIALKVQTKQHFISTRFFTTFLKISPFKLPEITLSRQTMFNLLPWVKKQSQSSHQQLQTVSGLWLVHSAYLSTLLVFPGVSKFFIKSPGLPVRAPNLPGTSYCPLIKMAPTLKIFGVVSRFLYSGGWQVWM